MIEIRANKHNHHIKTQTLAFHTHTPTPTTPRLPCVIDRAIPGCAPPRARHTRRRPWPCAAARLARASLVPAPPWAVLPVRWRLMRRCELARRRALRMPWVTPSHCVHPYCCSTGRSRRLPIHRPKKKWHVHHFDFLSFFVSFYFNIPAY